MNKIVPFGGNNQYDLYLQEIEGIDDYFGPTFRAIFDNDEHAEFRERLEKRIKYHDRDIERLCNIYYQGFIESIRELLEVRSQAKKLNINVLSLNDHLNVSAQGILKSGNELIHGRKVQTNIALVIAQLNLWLPVLTTYSKLQKQISEKRYYPALKSLEELEHLHLPHVANYRFSYQLRESIPKIRESIEQASMSDLKDFLENIRKFSPRIGEVAMKQTREQLTEDPTVISRKKKRTLPPSSDDPLNTITEDDLSAQELIDFSPIYRSLHISTVLGTKSTFETYYRAERTKQVRLVLQPPTNMHESEESYRFYIHAVLGFFITEDHVLNTGNGLITRTFLDEMWTSALSKIITALQTHSAYCTDATLILRIKDLIMLFCTTLRNYGYTVEPLWDLVRELRDHYTEVLMQRWVQVFREILSKEDFQPVQEKKINMKGKDRRVLEPWTPEQKRVTLDFFKRHLESKIAPKKKECSALKNQNPELLGNKTWEKIQDQEEFDNILSSFPWDEDLPDNVTFPYDFPFSSMVPKVYQQVKEFIYACLKFSEDLNLGQIEVDEMIRKSINLLLTRTFSGCLSSTFRNPRVGLQEIMQIIIDTGYLEASTTYLDQFISNITGEESKALSNNLVPGKNIMFQVAREDAVRQICEKLNQKVDEFLELQSYDWLLVEPQGHASGHISDLMAFLRTTFQSFTSLPLEVAQIACKSACEHIANAMFNLLMSDKNKQISLGALNQISLDLIQCELFAASEPVKCLQEDDLAYFTKFREILDLFTTCDWPTYFHDYGQETSKYKQVKPDDALILIEKLKEGDKKTMFTVLKKSERDKKKLLETVSKQLKQLSQIAPGK